MLTKQITWQKWINRFDVGGLSEETEFSKNTDDNLGNIEVVNRSKTLLPVIPTSNGLIPIFDREKTECVFWIGHTNFNITEDIFNIIDNVPGVEALKVLSRYRFKILVATLFEPDDVKQSIELMLCDGKSKFQAHAFEIDLLVDREKKLSMLDDEALTILGAKVQLLVESGKSYCVSMFPNGNIEYTLKKSEVRNLYHACKECGGISFVNI